MLGFNTHLIPIFLMFLSHDRPCSSIPRDLLDLVLTTLSWKGWKPAIAAWGATAGNASSALPCTESIKRISQNEAVNEQSEELTTEAEASSSLSVVGQLLLSFATLQETPIIAFQISPGFDVWWLVACSFVEITCRLRWKNIEIFRWGCVESV